jgi:hypothetical protein
VTYIVPQPLAAGLPPLIYNKDAFFPSLPAVVTEKNLHQRLKGGGAFHCPWQWNERKKKLQTSMFIIFFIDGVIHDAPTSNRHIWLLFAHPIFLLTTSFP